MFNKELFSERLKTLRDEKKMKQSELAKIIGRTGNSISTMEVGYAAPSVDVLCALADFFDVSLDYLSGRTDTKHSHKW